VRRRAQQPCNAEEPERDGRAHRRAQEARGLAPQLELPPQVVRVLDVLVGEQPEPERGAERRRNGGEPAGGEARVEERGPPVEGRPRAHEQRQKQRQKQRLLVVRPLEQRRGDAERDARRGHVVGGVEPPREPLRHEQQRGAEHAAREVGELDHAERQQPVQPLEPPGRRRSRAREEQQHAAEEGEHREQARGDALAQPADERRGTRGLRAPLPQLVGHERHERQREGQQVVDGAVDDERRQELRGREVGREQHEHQALEHAHAARDVARQREHLRAQVRAQQAQVAEAARGQEHEERRRGERPVERRHRELRTADARGRQRQLVASQADRTTPPDDGCEVAGDRQQHQPADGREQLVTGQLVRLRQRAEREAQAAERAEAQPEGDRVREHDPRQLRGAHAPARVEAVAHGGAREHRPADAVGDGVGEDRGRGDAYSRQRVADVGEGDHVVPGERRVVERGEQERRDEPRRRHREHGGAQLVPGDGVELAAQDEERRREQQQPGERGPGTAPRRPARGRPPRHASRDPSFS